MKRRLPASTSTPHRSKNTTTSDSTSSCTILSSSFSSAASSCKNSSSSSTSSKESKRPCLHWITLLHAQERKLVREQGKIEQILQNLLFYKPVRQVCSSNKSSSSLKNHLFIELDTSHVTQATPNTRHNQE